MGRQLVYRSDEADLDVEHAGRAWSFDADGELFRLAAEARRIRLAYLFDPRLAVHLSLLDPLPHQIQAVYGELLPRQPLRFALCDDPGAGKTIMAGLYIKELLLRGAVGRCLVVAPGGLVGQWQDEMADRFGLDFAILTRDMIEATKSADPFVEHDLLIPASTTWPATTSWWSGCGPRSGTWWWATRPTACRLTSSAPS